MDLVSLLQYVSIGAALVVVFKNFDERTSQYLAILCILFSALGLLAAADAIPFPSSWRMEILLPAATGILSLVILVRIQERSFALLLLALSGLQVLVQTEVIRSLR